MSTRSTERTHLNLLLSASLIASALALGLSLHTALRAQTRCPPEGTAPADPGLAPGVPVIARWQDAFWEATVVAAQGDLIAIAWHQPPPDLSYRPRGWIARMDEPPAAARAGDWLLCRASNDVWHPCIVESATGHSLQVVTIADARSHTVERAATLPVPPGLADWAARHGAAALERIRLHTRLQAVEPATAGKPARDRDRVLARWTDGTWWEAEVTTRTDALITVAWADGSTPTALPPAQVAPLSSAPPARSAGELALCKWGQSTRWWAAHIDESAAGLEIAYQDGTREPLAEQCIAGRVPER
jgi:hypothetical protein